MSTWLFMFAASRTLDYQFVIQPEFFDAQNCDMLRGQLQLDDSDPRKVRTVRMPTKLAGDILCAYRSGPVEMDAVDRVDSAGRKLLFAYGAVVNQVTPELLERIPYALDAARPAFETELASFLNCNGKWSPKIARSQEFSSGQGQSIRETLRRIFSPAGILAIALMFSLGFSIVLYFQKRALENELEDLRDQLKVLETHEKGGAKTLVPDAPPTQPEPKFIEEERTRKE